MALPQLVMKAPSRIFPFDYEKIRYPQYASIKFDGFRLLNLCGTSFLSPALKPFPNVNLHLKFKDFWKLCEEDRLVTDGEIWSPELTFNQLQSIIRSKYEPIPDSVGYYVFDLIGEDAWNGIEPVPIYVIRNYHVEVLTGFFGIHPVPQTNVANATEAQTMFDKAIDDGQEGIILRDPCWGYKHNRCTPNENGMWKFKQFETHDAVIVGVNQMQTLKGDVPRSWCPIRRVTERVYTQDSYEPSPAVGSFTVLYHGQEVNITPGRGFTLNDRRTWWQEYVANPNHFIGTFIEFKYMPHGTKDHPRMGSLVRFRWDKTAPKLNLGTIE